MATNETKKDGTEPPANIEEEKKNEDGSESKTNESDGKSIELTKQGKEKNNKRQSEAEKLLKENELQNNYLRSGKNRQQSVRPKDEQWIRNYHNQFPNNNPHP